MEECMKARHADMKDLEEGMEDQELEEGMVR